jgi:hypothetical protein
MIRVGKNQCIKSKRMEDVQTTFSDGGEFKYLYVGLGVDGT